MHKIVNKVFKHEKGFSLLELAVAVGIAAIVTVVGVTASTVFLNDTTGKSSTYKASAEAEIEKANASYDAVLDGLIPPEAETPSERD